MSMQEDLVFQISARNRSSGELRKLEGELKRLGLSVDKVNRGSNYAGAGIDKLGRASAGSSNNLRMMSMQLSQVASQGSATGNYMQALAIQMPDLMLGFGAVGIAAGALVPVLFGLASNFLGAGESAQQLAKDIETITGSSQTAREELSMLRLGLASVEEVRLRTRIAEIDREIATQRATIANAHEAVARSAQVVVDRLSAEKTELEGILATQSQVTSEVERLKQAIATTDVERELGEGMRYTYEQTREAEEMTRLMKDGLTASAIQALELAGIDIASGVSAAASEAARLAGNLNIALNAAINLRNAQGSKQYGGRGGDPRQFMNNDYGKSLDYKGVDHWIDVFTPASSKGGGGGGGGGSAKSIDETARALENLRSQLDPAYASMKKLTEARDLLDVSLKNGEITLAEHNRLLDLAEEKFTETGDAMSKYAERAGDFMADLGIEILENIDNLEDLKKAVGNFVKQALLDLARLALSKLFTTAFSAILGGPIGGGLGGALGGGLMLPSLAGGGYTGNSARSGGVDGMGGFPAILHPRETVIDHTRGQSVSGGELVVNINGNIPRSAVRKQKGRIDIEVGQMVVDVIASGAADQIMRQKFGLSGRGQGV